MRNGWRFSPIKYSAALAISYLVFGLFWIFSSTRIASNLAVTQVELERLELYKGFGFIGLSALLLLGFSYSMFKRMATGGRRLVQSQQRLVQAEREALGGLIAASVGHDFANLLTVLRLSAERLRGRIGKEETVRDIFMRLDHSISRLAELSSRLQNVRNASQNLFKGEPNIFDLSKIIRETLDLLRDHESVTGCRVVFEPRGSVEMRGYPILVHQLLMNLLLNAAEATDGKGIIRIALSRQGGVCTLEVHDNGPGVSPILRDTVFTAFFTTKLKGTGLGLLSVKSCVDLHGGGIEISDSPLGGALFRITLPDLEETRNAALKFSEVLNKNGSHASTFATP